MPSASLCGTDRSRAASGSTQPCHTLTLVESTRRGGVRRSCRDGAAASQEIDPVKEVAASVERLRARSGFATSAEQQLVRSQAKLRTLLRDLLVGRLQ